MCGHVNDDLRHLWYVSCDCYYDMSDEEIKKAKRKNKEHWMIFYRCLLKTLMSLNEDPYLHVKLVLPSRIQRKSKISMREYLYSPTHIPDEEPIVVLGQNSTYIGKADFDKICWRNSQGAARNLNTTN